MNHKKQAVFKSGKNVVASLLTAGVVLAGTAYAADHYISVNDGAVVITKMTVRQAVTVPLSALMLLQRIKVQPPLVPQLPLPITLPSVSVLILMPAVFLLPPSAKVH